MLDRNQFAARGILRRKSEKRERVEGKKATRMHLEGDSSSGRRMVEKGDIIPGNGCRGERPRKIQKTKKGGVSEKR